MTRPSTWFLCLCLLTLTTAYAVFTGGADDPTSFAVTVGLLGLAGVAGGLLLFQAGPASRAERRINLAAFAFILYVAFQLVPLPIALVRVISPMRAEIADALSDITGAARYAPLSVAPPTTWIHLSRICAYAIAFFVARQLVRRSPFGAWTAVMPLVFIAASQAAWALLTHEGAELAAVSGSYPNRNHFAGLLEMTLPLAIGYSVSVLYRSGRRGVLAMTDVAKAVVPLSIALLLFAAILVSSSKGGTVASLLSLFFMSALWLGRGLPNTRRWPFLALLTVLLLIVFVFLTPSSLVERFGEAAASQDSEGRVPIWRDTLHLIAAYPIFGVGFGAFFPAFLRYQFAGAGLAWTNTHNDYLQLLSELGVVGFIAPALLLMSLFGRTIDAASEREAGETRFIGLACSGALLALLIHSLTDFNTYVTANGLVLAWIAGVAATLGPSAAEGYSPQPGPRRVGYGVAPAVVALGVLSAAYGAAWLQFLQRYQGNAAAESMFCRFGVCDADSALAEVRAASRARSADDRPVAPASALLKYLNRDRSAPYRWDELGLALVREGRRDEARVVLARAVMLGPTSASTLLTAAEFEFDDGREQEGLALTSRALMTTNDQYLRDLVFRLLDDKHVVAAQALPQLKPDKTTSLALLNRYLHSENANLDAARDVWRWIVDRGEVSDDVSRDYTATLLANQRARDGWQDWLRYAKTKGADEYPEKNFIFNGRFRLDSRGGPFDWEIGQQDGAAIRFDPPASATGGRTLRITFDGRHNVGDIGVGQRVCLAAGSYVFRARVKSEALTTDQGVSFRITSDSPSGALNIVSEPVRGSTEWIDVASSFDVAEDGQIVTIQLTRRPSLRFDKLVKGTFLVEQVSIARGP